MDNMAQLDLIRETLGKCLWVVGIGAVLLIAVNIFTWRKWK